MITNSILHYTIIREIIENGFAPSAENLSEILQAEKEEILKGLYELQEYHGVVLHPNKPKIWVIHPFSLAPTNFYLKSKKGEWWGNCAWCSLGIAALVKEDVTITTSLGAEGTSITLHIREGQLVEKDYVVHFPIAMQKAWDNVIYTCSNMLIFENEKQIDEWTKRHDIPKGDIQPIDNIWSFSKKWYGNHLNPEWTKWTIEEAKQMFEEFRLNDKIWKLEDSKERF